MVLGAPLSSVLPAAEPCYALLRHSSEGGIAERQPRASRETAERQPRDSREAAESRETERSRDPPETAEIWPRYALL